MACPAGHGIQAVCRQTAAFRFDEGHRCGRLTVPKLKQSCPPHLQHAKQPTGQWTSGGYIHPSIYPPGQPSIHPSTHPSTDPSIHPSIHLHGWVGSLLSWVSCAIFLSTPAMHALRTALWVGQPMGSLGPKLGIPKPEIRRWGLVRMWEDCPCTPYSTIRNPQHAKTCAMVMNDIVNRPFGIIFAYLPFDYPPPPTPPPLHIQTLNSHAQTTTSVGKK